ncbi:MAG: hypothetical protein GY704_03510 [Phycisphaeraceae bacterium]|nr:hypothetical protein [Phycisphaeraceae bacterium]
MSATVAHLGALIVGVAASWLVAVALERYSCLSIRLLLIAAALVPEDERDDQTTEWLGDLADCHGPATTVNRAAGFVLAGLRINSAVRTELARQGVRALAANPLTRFCAYAYVFLWPVVVVLIVSSGRGGWLLQVAFYGSGGATVVGIGLLLADRYRDLTGPD